MKNRLRISFGDCHRVRGFFSSWVVPVAACLALSCVLLYGGATNVYADSCQTADASLCRCLSPYTLPVFHADEGDEQDSDNQKDSGASASSLTPLEILANADGRYDGRGVSVQGEAVGEAIRDDVGGSYVWVTLEDEGGTYPVSVRMSAEQASQITRFGAYGQTGSTVQVEGTFYLGCSEHYGVSDIHADKVIVLDDGSMYKDEFHYEDFQLGLVLVGVGVFMILLFNMLRRRSL